MPEKLADLAGGADGDVAASGGWHELAVANPTFLLERLGSECTDLQGLREVTVNGLEAIATLDADRPGRVVWDLDWGRFESSGGRARKLSVIDTGAGMTAGQLRHYINQLAASGREQSPTGNFGVGAKVAAGSRNPHGLEYRSWHHGDGSLVCFKRDLVGRWGLEPQRWADGRTDYWRPLGKAEKPWLLRGHDHGTQVVLLGQHERHDTTQAPASVTDARRHWITRYLAGRFLRFPSQVEVLVREYHGPDRHALRQIHGEQHHLEQHAVAAGTVALSDAIVRWWVHDAHRRLQRDNDRLWSDLHPDGLAAVYGEHPAAFESAITENHSEVLGAPDPLQAVQRSHSPLDRPRCDYQAIAENRRQLAAAIGEITCAFVDELVAAGWSESDARSANVHNLLDTVEAATDDEARS